jgi:hypothetical protein
MTIYSGVSSRWFFRAALCYDLDRMAVATQPLAVTFNLKSKGSLRARQTVYATINSR